MFQSSVNFQQGFGVVGELAYTGPTRSQPGILKSADPTLNVIGRAAMVKAGATGSFNVAADPKTLNVTIGEAGTGIFAGILFNPKAYVGLGTTAGGTLAPSITLPNETEVELLQEGYVVAALGAASNPGDYVYFTVATGVLVTAAPGAAQPALSFGPIGTVERFVDAAASLAVVHVDPSLAKAVAN